MKYEYATLEWIWDSNSLKINLPSQDEKTSEGSYKEVVMALTSLGAEGWEVVTCVTEGNWLFWTLKRNIL